MRQMDDSYDSGEYRWWHLSEPSPELREALSDGWISPGGRAVDLGCGLGVEVDYLAVRGFLAVGVDISSSAIHCARRLSTRAHFVQADRLDHRWVPSDTRMMEALIARLERREC